MTRNAPHVLVVEDDDAVANALRVALEGHGYTVQCAPDGARGVLLASANRPDLVLLDLGLPDIDGIEVLRRIRAVSRVPVVILSVRDAQSQKIDALDAGADDYVTKPFAIGELVARLRAALRRAAPSAVESTITTDDFVLDLEARRATRGDGTEVHLTSIEWAITAVLGRRPGRLVTHRELVEAVWGATAPAESTHVRVHLANLRRKLEPDPARPRHFRTEPRVGYRFGE